ncbi:MAG TPA: 4-(cytidine 5'-diphospho)-2-C-methyl-D-erythritol kinase [Candidatus Eisenbacteria bacterium]|nr:4-(cytidine 5'-diphospho)-2-C-methyl-D-erythritol kinase [Candidatus Eisenbacteria bacterium]
MTRAARAARSAGGARGARAARANSSRGAGSSAVRVRCPAKVNLGLWILGRRPDGYHEIDTILQAITLEDELLLTPEAAPGCRLVSTGRPIPGDAPNLITRAWDLLAGEAPALRGKGVSVRLLKRIPIGAGLGGGSSDAAGLLAGANALFDLGLPPEELERFGASLGSDVPFFLRGGTARGTGRGEVLRHLRPLPPTWGVVVSPPVAVSTSWAYGLLRNRLTVGASPASILASAVARGDVGAAVDARFNAFEDVVLTQVPLLARLKQAFVAAGAWGALLSGSGSSLFTLARTEVEARSVAAAIGACDADVRVVRTRERGVTVARGM